MKKIMKLRKEWKVLCAVIFAVFAFSGYVIYANASTEVNMTLNTKSITVGQNMDSVGALYISDITGTDDNRLDPDPALNHVPNPNNITWKTSDSNIVSFTDGGGSETTNGTHPVIHGGFAGTAKLTATYVSKQYGDNGAIVSEEAITSVYADVTVPLSVQMDNVKSLYQVGDIINITANTCETNRLFVSSLNDGSGTLGNDGVVELVSSTANSVQLRVCGGGYTKITVRTVDGDGISNLSKSFEIRAEVLFDTSRSNSAGHKIMTLASGEKYMVLDRTDFADFTYEEVPSNVKIPETSGVTYRSADTSICGVKYGNVIGVRAGFSTVTAGLCSVDQLGNEVWTSRDTVTIVVPFKKMGKDVSNMNVGDTLQLSTSADPTTVTWSTSNNTVAQVDPSTGLVTAVGAGKTTIYAVREQDELYTKYGQECQLKYELTVIDAFGLSLDKANVNIGESFDLEALVTNDVTKYPVEFKVENQAGPTGIVPTGNLVTIKQDGKVLTVTGAASGTVKITATQNINGVVKSASCIVYVTTPVGDISINPSSLRLNRGEQDTVQVLFNPSGPTNDNVLWYTSNPEVATVEGDSYTATIKGVSGGSATISVISEDGLKIATCDVYVREPVTGVVLNETTVHSSMAVGQYQLKATVLPDGDGVNRNVTWSSSDESVCTVDTNGLVKFVKPGYATIICKTEDNAFMATCNFFISIPVENITLDYTDEIMRVGDTLRITAAVTPIEASDKTVVWESSNTNVCVVDSTGFVQAVGVGSCTILCKSYDGNATAMCNIYVKQPVTSVVLNVNDITVRKGQVFWLNATCLPENADNKICTWTSRDESVCTVENDGKVTAVGAGTTSIIVTNTDSGLTAFCVVTVTQPVTGITLNSDYQLLWVGAKYAIIPNIEPYDAENKKVTYLSSDPSVATVDENGIVTAVSGGTCIIEVTTEECSLTAACTIDVKEYVSSITLSETDKFMNIGASGTLVASVQTSTATNKAIVWSSSDDSVCSVDGDGNIYANSVGNAVITATAADGSGVSASCLVRVVNPVSSIWIEPDTVRMLVGDSQRVYAHIEPEDATVQDVTWVSSNEAVATVDESGEIFALGTGKCKVTAISADGNAIQGSCWVYVTPVINISSLKINSKEIYMLNGKSRQLSVRVRPANNTDSYSWYSTDTGIVVVDNDGVITTVGPGEAEVVVESDNAGVSSSCIVHSLAISKSYITLEQYDQFWLDVIGTSDNVIWRSSNPRVCTITQSGAITARKAGTTTVTAVVDNKTLTCTVKVTNFR